MTDREYLAEAREWLEEVKKLAGLAKDEKWYQKRLNTLEWLIQQTEEAEKLEAKVEQYEKALYALYKMAYDSEADLMIDVLVDVLKGYGLEKHFEEMYREGKQQFMEAGW